jgi:hypothetical protein
MVQRDQGISSAIHTVFVTTTRHKIRNFVWGLSVQNVLRGQRTALNLVCTHNSACFQSGADSYYSLWVGPDHVSLSWPTITGNNVIWRKDQIPWVGQTAIWLWATTPNEKNGRDRGLPFNTADPPFTSKNQTHMVIELSYEESGEANSNGFADFIGWKNVRGVR